jgi:hypothetical protein
MNLTPAAAHSSPAARAARSGWPTATTRSKLFTKSGSDSRAEGAPGAAATRTSGFIACSVLAAASAQLAGGGGVGAAAGTVGTVPCHAVPCWPIPRTAVPNRGGLKGRACCAGGGRRQAPLTPVSRRRQGPPRALRRRHGHQEAAALVRRRRRVVHKRHAAHAGERDVLGHLAGRARWAAAAGRAWAGRVVHAARRTHARGGARPVRAEGSLRLRSARAPHLCRELAEARD